MAKQQTYDATKMGPLSWRQLQLANQEAYANLDIDDDLRGALQQVTNNMSIPNSGSPEINWEGRVQSPIMRNSNGRDYWGKSMWDEQVADANDFENNLSDLRGQNQPWYAQLGAGLLKGITTAATTWLDGTVGLLYGIGSAIHNGDNKTGWDRAAQIFHNDVSNALQDFNEFMEEFAPNYKSRDEENNKWYQNMGTMNFWADGLIKNLGFTVGAFYSGAAFTKAIKGVGGLIAAGKAGNAAKAYKAGKVKELMEAGMSAEEAAKAVNPMATATRYTNTLKAIEGARSGTGIAVAGSLFSAVNEGRIEANQVYRDAFTLGNTPEESKGAAAEILAARNRKMQEIEDNPTLLPSEKQALQAQVQANSQKLLAEAEQNAAKAGMLTLGLNIPILTIDNFKMYGRLYSRGFKQSVKQVGNNVTTQELKAAQDAVKNAVTKQEKEAAKRALREAERKAKAAHNARNNARIDDVAENVTDKEGRLAWNEITKGQAAWKGIKSGLMEGNEEMMQAWASGTAGNMTMPEDPDAYYKALTDPNATVKTNDFLTSVTKGFLDSYGNGDRWEEGAIGFLTGILGMPTFGARANSDSNTYLGRGKMIGLSGGFFGEFSNANYLNRLGAESVKNLNAFRDKYKQHAQFLAQSQAFTDAMDGYLQDKNEFAYNNARDNDDYAMIQALAVTGRIDEVKTMLNFKEEDLTDDVLDSVANDFTENSNLVDSDSNPKTVDDSGKPLQGAWRDKAGNLMSRTKEGKAEMKAKLLEKQKRLNEEIDDYVASLDSVRAQVNNSLDESQVRELAWLDWKNKQWSRRFQDMQGEQAKAFEFLINKATDEMKDLKSESDTYKALSNFKELIEKAQKAKSPIELLAALAKNNAFLDTMSKKVGKVAIEQEGGIYQIADEFLGDLITSDEEGLSAVETVGKALGDIRLMAIAQKQFKEKLDEYTSNPAKLAANRQKIENERQQQRDVTDTINQTSELSSKKLRDFLDMDDDEFDTAEQNPILAEMEGVDLSTKENKAAFEEAKKIRKKKQDLLNKINSSDKLNAEQKKNAVALIQAAYNNATSLDNFTDLSNEAYTDPNNVPVPDNGNMTSDEIEAYQRDVSDSMQQVLGSIMNEDDSALDLPSTEEAKEAAKNGIEAEFNFNDEHNTTGNSEVATPSESENERVERENEEKAKKDADKKRKDELNNFIEELTEVFGPKDKRDKAKTFLWDIANGFISSYLKEGEFPKKDQSVNGAKASNAFNGLLSLCENDSQTDWVNNVIIEKLYDKVRQLYDPTVIAQAKKEAQEKAEREQKKQDKERENPITVVLIESTADDISNKISNKVDKEQKDEQKEHQYWKPTTTEYGIGEKAYDKGNYIKFSDRAQSMNYSSELKKKIVAVAKYFEDKEVWDRINSGDNGKVAAGRKVGFKIDPKLNEDAGEVIILLTDEDGNVIGDLDSHATNQAHLQKFIEYAKNQFEKFSVEHKGEVFVLTQPNSNRPLVTKITQCMIGKVPYGDEYITLNEANDTNIDDDNKKHKYYLGIAVADADGNVRVKATSQKVGSLGYIDRQIKQPIIEKNDGLVAGTPFLLVKSEGSNSYMCVPIITPTFDSEHYDEIMNSAYGSVIRKYIGDIEAIVKNQGSAYKNLTQEQKPFRIKEILNDLFVGKFYVEYNKSNNTYTFKVNNSDFYANVSFEDEVPEGANKFSVEDLLQSISGHSLGLQISRKYINGNNPRHNEKGQQINFNKAIGSIAKVNIMPMSRLQKQDGQHTSYLHTVDDWFTLNPLLVSTDTDGKVTIRAQEVEAPVSVGSNNAPKAITNMTLTTTIKDEKTGENKETTVRVSVDYEDKSVTINERKIPVDSKNANKNLLKIARTAYAIEKARRDGATKTVETSWGTFDLKTNTFVNDTSVRTDNTISDTATDDDLFNMLAADNAQIQAESTPTTEQQPATQQTSEQQSTTPQVSEQAPSTEITREERKEITKNNQVQLPSNKFPSGNNNIGGYLAQISDNEGGSFGRVADTDDGSSSYYRMFDVNGDTAKFEFYAPQREQKAMMKWSSILDTVADYEGDTDTADTIFTVEAGEVKKNSNGRWVVTKRAKLQLVKKEDIVDNVYTDTEAVKRDIDSLQRSKNEKKQAWENQREREQSTPQIETVQESTSQEIKQEVEQKPVENPVQLPTAQEVLEAKPEEIEKAAKELYTDICGKNGEKIYDALTPEQRSAIANLDNQDAVLERLNEEFKSKTGKFKKDVDSIIAEYNTKYSRVNEEEREVWDREKELAWLKKALPQLSNEQRVQIVDGLIKIKNSDNPGYAWGQFYRGLITISNEAASGTLYHEAFHAVIDLLMTEDEYNKLFDAAYQVWGNLGMLGLEEKLAEEFRKFVQYGDNAAFVDYDAEDIKTPIIRGIVRLFRRLKALIQGLSNKQIYLNKLFYDINKGKFANRKIKENVLDKVTTRQEEDAQLVLDRNPELASVGTAREYAAYINDIFPNSVEKDIYWHGSNEDFSDGFNTAKRGEGSGALETKKRNDLYLNRQGWASLQYVNGVNRQGSDKNGFAHWNKLWWELKEIMSNGRRENNDWKDIVITDKDVNSIRQAIPNKRGKFDRDKGGTHGKWLKERKADYGYENKSDKEFFEEVFGLQLGKDTFNTWTARNAEVFKAMETTAKGIYPVVINVTNPIVEEGQNTYYEEQRGLFSQADRNGNDAILSRRADNEFNSDVAVVINASNKNVHWLGTKSDVKQFRQWKTKNVKQPKFDINERELEDIKKKAIADGTFMKAPNGNPTNLNERQWLQVRTKAFKKWFGDWISDPESASKVVDENGEPLVVYHTVDDATVVAGKAQFRVFSKEENGGKMFYFTDNKLMSESYTNRVPTYKTMQDVKNRINKIDSDIQSIENYIEELKNPLPQLERRANNKSMTVDEYIKDLGFDSLEDYKNQNSSESRINFEIEKVNKLKKERNKLGNFTEKDLNPTRAFFINSKTPLFIEGNGANWDELQINGETKESIENKRKYENDKNKYRQELINEFAEKRDKGTFDSYQEYGIGPEPFELLAEEDIEEINKRVSEKYPKDYSADLDNLSTRGVEASIETNKDSSIDGFIVSNVYDYGPSVAFNSKYTEDNLKSGTVVAVRNPNQIKSATDNVGTFSRENDDIRYSRVKTELDNKVVEFAEAINKSIAETMTLNRYAQNWDYVNKGIPVRKPDASDNDGRKAYFGIKNPIHFYKGQWTISNGASKKGGKSYHEAVKNEVFRRLAMVGMLDKFNALFDVTWNDVTNHYVINLKAPEKIATLSEIVDFDSIPDDVLADMMVEEEKQAKEYSKNREKEILNGATKHTTTLFEGKTKVGLGKLLENMISAGVNRNKVALYRNIIDRLGELKDIEVEISDNKDIRFSDGKAAGWYFPSGNNIILLNNLDDSFLEDSIVHETLHAIVSNTVKDKEKLDKVVAVVGGIKKAVLEEYGVKSINDIQDSETRRLFYGLTNADEFISEFFSNSQFHDYVKNKQATWYNRFIDFVKSILGLDVDITKIVKDLLSDFNGQIQEVRQTISMQNQLGTIFRDIADLSKQAVRPQEDTEKQEPSIKQYHIQNLMYENLSEEDKEYIKEKGLSREEYDDFSMTEKENLWYCR